ncbi:MAG: MFS transporter [archaeon]|jgi:MFS family permease
MSLKFVQSEEQQKIDFKFSVLDGIFWSMMFYLTSVFLTPYLIALGANSFEVGLLSYAPLLIAAITCFFSYEILKLFNSKKQMVVFFVMTSAVLWIPVGFAHVLFVGKTQVWFVLIIATVYTIISQFLGPVYTDWIGNLFNLKKMGDYNARKSIILQLISIIPLILAGYLLQAINNKDTLLGFTIIFIFAGFCRFISGLYLNTMSKTEDKEEILKETVHTKKPMFSVFKEEILKDKTYFYFMMVVLIYYFSLYVTAPYNKFYLLNIVKLTYTQYLTLEITMILGVITSLFYWGKACDKFGATKILKATMLFLPLYPLALILFPQNMVILTILVFIDAVITAGLGLSITTYIYQNLKENLITHFTFFMLFQAVALTIGALLGVLINKIATGYYGTETKGIIIVFIVGIFFRVITAIFTSKIKDKNLPQKKDTNIVKEIILFRPVRYGIGELSKVFSRHQKNITHKVSRKTKSIHKDIKDTTKRFTSDFSKNTNRLTKKLNLTRKEIISKTKKAIKKTKQILDK